jgi:hypothetical protein
VVVANVVRAFAIALIGCWLPMIEAQSKVFTPANDVSFTIASEHSSYKIGEPITFVYRIRNISHAAVFAPRWVWDVQCPAPPHVWAGLEDSSGKHYIPGYGGSCLGPNKIDVPQAMRKASVLLKPGEVFQNSFQLETTMFRATLMPGDYRLEATLSDGVITNSLKRRRPIWAC